MINKNRMVAKAAEYNIDASAYVDRLNDYAQLMVEYNKKINLSRILEPQDIEDKHFLDCLHLAHQPFVNGRCCDVGSGAGFPGAVIAIARPELSVTLIEPTGKRCVFLSELAKSLKLSNVTVINGRAEELARKELRESFELVTARAVAALPILLEYCLPLCSVGGSFAAMKGTTESIEDGQKASEILGGDSGTLAAYNLPAGDSRLLMVYKKIAPTDPKYPRNGGRIAKSPL